MTDHGWPDHHDDDPGYHDPYDEHLQVDEHTPFAAEPDYADAHHDLPPPDDDPHPDPGHDIAYEHHPADTTADHTPDTGDPQDVATVPDVDTDTVFPPAVDVGPLPEPVDGFPWIDTGSLGVVDPDTVHPSLDPIDPHDLAEYAGAELTPGADPWATLADSEDPATAALARWWAPPPPPST